MPQLNEIRNIILSMKAQSKAQTKNEVPQIEGSAALAIEPKHVKIAEPMQLIRGGKLENSNSDRPNPQTSRGPLDIVVPISKVDSFVNYVNSLECESGMQMISFGHAGDGNVHLCVVRGDRPLEIWEKELHDNLEKLYAQTDDFGGLISGEHGLGVSKRDFFFARTKLENVQLMNRIKLAFDPKKILNSNISYVE